MVLNTIWNHLFGSSHGRKKTETITARVIDETFHDAASIAVNQHSSAITTTTSAPTIQRRPYTASTDSTAPNSLDNDVSNFSLYILFVSLFVCIFTICVLVLVHINRSTDINQLHDNFKNRFIAKSDIKQYVWDALNELRVQDDSIFIDR